MGLFNTLNGPSSRTFDHSSGSSSGTVMSLCGSSSRTVRYPRGSSSGNVVLDCGSGSGTVGNPQSSSSVAVKTLVSRDGPGRDAPSRPVPDASGDSARTRDPSISIIAAIPRRREYRKVMHNRRSLRLQ